MYKSTDAKILAYPRSIAVFLRAWIQSRHWDAERVSLDNNYSNSRKSNNFNKAQSSRKSIIRAIDFGA